MDAEAREGLASLITDTLRLEREVSFVDREECSKVQGSVSEKSVAVFKILRKRVLSSHASRLRDLFGQSQDCTQNHEFMAPWMK